MQDGCLVFSINFIQLQKESNSLSSSSVRLPLLKEIKFYDKRVSPLSLAVSEKVSARIRQKGKAQECWVNYRLPLKIHSSSW